MAIIITNDGDKVVNLGNQLKYVDEEGTTTSIDLSLYLDDTNLARITSGSVSGNTLVFSRDDGSTFSIDASAFTDSAGQWVGETVQVQYIYVPAA